MIALTEATVRLAEAPRNKEEAIRRAASLLAENGHIAPEYAESMLGREKVANTYLGSGIAIPHGLLKDRELIHATGLAVLQVPAGVEWNPGEIVHLVVAIAAASDEHLQILANLTQVLADDDEVAELVSTTDPAVVVGRLTRTGETASAPAAPGIDLDGYAAADVVLGLASGLHARPATMFVDVAKGFTSDVRVRCGEKVANGKSLAALLTLGADRDAELTLLAKGDDQGAALAALVAAVASGLGDEDDGPTEDAAPTPSAVPAWAPNGAAVAVPGIGASPGLAIGPLWHLKRRHLVVERTAKDPEAEEQKLRTALASARAELRELHDDVKARSGGQKAAIFRAHEAFLDDPDLLAAVSRTIRRGHSAGWAWREEIATRAGELENVDDPLLAARAADLGDVGNRVLAFLAGVDDTDAELPGHPVVLIADDLTPSDTAAIDPARVIGFCTAAGGPTSHTAIIARALGIPAIVGAGPAALAQPAGSIAVLDGSGGTLWIGVDDADLESAHHAQQDREVVRAEEHRTRYEPAITIDGHRVEIVANVNRASEAAAAVEAGAEGVGLMRTEFLFLGRDEPPSEEEQYEALAEMVRVLNGLPLIVRTLDIGGDKNAPYLDLPVEDNSFLGIRGIRLCLERPDLFRAQLRSIYRASQLGPLAVMFPMIARLEDLEAAIVHAERARTEIGAQPIDIGIMIEVPSAVVLAPELARRVQFFSIGTNDLTQYVLAMDRLHPVLAKQADALHPAVLRMIKATVDAADGAGIWVGVCGGVAGEPEGALVLTGLGVRELSVSVPAVAAVKARLRAVRHTDARRLAERALACATATEVRALVLP
ncbi:MAG: phosphoenolpyruvate--protein phosphotransferase [Ilumatobacteraceae bacterium]